MKSSIFRILIVAFILAAFSTSNPDSLSDKENIISRNYCTEIGRFDMFFYGDQLSGSYALLPKKSLGVVWGTVDKNIMTGRWMDGDGTGDIIITFNADFSWFTTRYRSDEHPDKWYNDQWHGALRSGNGSSFEHDGKNYRCE